MFNLYINNFRSFKEQNFEFSRINILIGENSGGKSSLLKFLLSLKQTLESPFESNLKLIGNYTDLGNYEEMIYNKNKELNLEFEFSNSKDYTNYFIKLIDSIDSDFEEEKQDLEEGVKIINGIRRKRIKKILKIINDYDKTPTKAKFILNNKLDEHNSIRTQFHNENLGDLEIISKKIKNEDFFRELNSDLVINFKNFKGTIKDCVSYKEGFFTLIGGELKSKLSKDFNLNDDEIEIMFYSLAYLLIFQNYINSLIDRIRFVNPIGTSPKRFYFNEDKKSNYKLIDIEKFINILGNSSLSKKESDERLNLLNNIIKKFGIAEEKEIKKNSELPIVALNIKTKDFWSNITDVGYGVSLQLPILFQALLSENYTEEGETILIEQPEVHLHPNLQAKFISSLLSIGNKNSYFIETHSEHIIRKLQILVKNKEFGLTSNDISIYYFKREKEKFEISKHKILENGTLSKKFPDGFYDTSYSLVKELLE